MKKALLVSQTATATCSFLCPRQLHVLCSCPRQLQLRVPDRARSARVAAHLPVREGVAAGGAEGWDSEGWDGEGWDGEGRQRNHSEHGTAQVRDRAFRFVDHTS